MENFKWSMSGFYINKKHSFGTLYFTRKVVFPYAWMLGFYLIYEMCQIIYEKKTLYFFIFKSNIWRKPRRSKRIKANHCPFIGCTKSFIFTFFDDPFSCRSRWKLIQRVLTVLYTIIVIHLALSEKVAVNNHRKTT